MWLLIDDMRDLGCEVIARTPDAARKILTAMGREFECVCLDHDLGTDETGLDVLRYGLEFEVMPNRVQLVTSNLPGKKAMQGTLQDAGYFSEDNGTNWRIER